MVDGVEPEPARAEIAARWVDNLYQGMAGPEIVLRSENSYDLVVFTDVLEHVAQPEELLDWAASAAMTKTGRVFASVPNSANWQVRLRILRGNWNYEENGFFDRDHLRFYSPTTAAQIRSKYLDLETTGFTPHRLPRPLHRWHAGSSLLCRSLPSLFASHILLTWRGRTR
jgi:hypothetical protein